MSPKWNSGGRRFLVGPSLVGNQGFWSNKGAYPRSAFGTAIPTYRHPWIAWYPVTRISTTSTALWLQISLLEHYYRCWCFNYISEIIHPLLKKYFQTRHKFESFQKSIIYSPLASIIFFQDGKSMSVVIIKNRKDYVDVGDEILKSLTR